MPRSPEFASVLALALLAAALPAGRAGAIEPHRIDVKVLREDAQTRLTGGLAMLRRVLHVKQDQVVSHAIQVNSREASLEFETSTGRSRTMVLRGGKIVVDGDEVGRYTPGGALERAWRRLLADGAELETREMVVAARAWRVNGLEGDEAQGKARLDLAMASFSVPGKPQRPGAAPAAAPVDVVPVSPERRLVRLVDLASLGDVERQVEALDEIGPDVARALRESPMHVGDVRVAAGERHEGDLVVYRGTVDVYGHVTGNVVALFGDVVYREGAVIDASAVAVGGAVQDQGGTVRGDVKTISTSELEAAAQEAAELKDTPAAATALDRVFHDVRNMLAVFVACAMLGFGTVFFGRRYLEVVADTAAHSFGRSLVVGLLGQLLLLPTFGMLIVGLALTVVGILLLPFAAVAYVVAAILAFVGGYLAVAHAIGERVARRRMAHGAFVRAPNAYGYLFSGLIGLMGLWAAAALTGWMGPVVIVFKVAAVLVTWVAVTVGFGAVLLARGGLRETFAGRHMGEVTDEYLWSTPVATPTAATMGRDK